MIRFMYPQYNDISDYELSKAYHQKYHPEMPYDQFAKEFDGPLQEDKVALAVKKYNLDNPEHPITKDKIRDLKGAKDYVGLLFEGAWDSTDDFLESVARAWRGGNIDPNNETWADRTIRQKQKDSAARIPTRQEIEGDALANALYQGPKTVATSLATTLGGMLIGGAAGTAVGGPAGAPIGGVIGAVPYRD